MALAAAELVAAEAEVAPALRLPLAVPVGAGVEERPLPVPLPLLPPPDVAVVPPPEVILLEAAPLNCAPSVGSATSPLTSHRPLVKAGQAGGLWEGL